MLTKKGLIVHLFIVGSGADSSTMAEVAVAAGSTAPAAAAFLGLVGLEHDKYRQPHAQRREQDIKHDQSTSPQTSISQPSPEGNKKTRPPKGAGKPRQRFGLCCGVIRE